MAQKNLKIIHFLWKWKGKLLSCVCLRPYGLYSPWNSPGQNTGVSGGLFLLQGIFPTQRLNPGLLHCRWILYQLSHKGSIRMLEWEAYPFPRGSSQPRNRTRVSCIAGVFLSSKFPFTSPMWSESCSVVSDSLPPHGLYSPQNSPDQNTGVGSLSLLQGIFPTQRSNPGLLHCRWILYQLSHNESPYLPYTLLLFSRLELLWRRKKELRNH